MKKMMVLVAAAAMAIASQAAQFDWAAGRNAMTDYKNMTAYCVNGGNYDKAIEVLTTGGADVATEFAKLVSSQGTIGNGGSLNAVTNTGVDGTNKTAAWFIFANNTIADGSSYDTTGALDVSSSVYTPPESGTAFAIANAKFTSKVNVIGAPEPTSGLLLLLGMAGLALRRRRA